MNGDSSDSDTIFVSCMWWCFFCLVAVSCICITQRNGRLLHVERFAKSFYGRRKINSCEYMPLSLLLATAVNCSSVKNRAAMA